MTEAFSTGARTTWVEPGSRYLKKQARDSSRFQIDIPLMAKTEYRIVSGEESEIHDEPHIEGRRLTVRFVHDRVEGRGLDPGTVADRHDLDVADVYRALAYYHDHPEEMSKVERRRREMIEQHEDELVGPEDVES